MKPTQITAEQYLQDQLDKHIVTDPLEDILKQIEKQTPMNYTYTHNKQATNTQNGTHARYRQLESMTKNSRDNINQMDRRLNSGLNTV